MKQIIPAILLTALLFSCNDSKEQPESVTETTVSPSPANPAPAAAGPTLPSFQMVDANNQVLDLTGFKGKKVFVNLWATWCPPCRAEIPSIEKLAAKLDPAKTAFVMLSLDDQFEKAKNYAKKNQMTLPVYYPAVDLPPLFNVNAIPVTFIFNENGELIHRQDGSADYNSSEFIALMKK